MGEAKKKRIEEIPELDERGFLKDHKDLEAGYRQTHKLLREAIVATGEDGTHPDELILRGAISDVNYAINWMQTGRRPGSKRGIERRSVYQNTVLMDPMIIANFSNAYNSRSGSTLTPEEADRLRDALEILSPQERECYVMAYGHCYSHAEIAKTLKISKGAVDKYVKRAHEKVSRGWQGTLF
ncbi:sigma-70 family RNA polymerase sigma factor [Paenibacillus harenae]|uniref:RNA polymerase sigma-70 factor (ECF subfamily) n=1 Tax=Paenibacillus harenae TaxID=306543 RepID=A0ABT9U3S8_PAEHA|nr:sigma-70 family RNA polymerase sigma factor [Paenibacillus harenae]MDQ0114304.1 RNA polymerase sigma-70 factor (ECF subfamily) [Paenibacillus harenae]